MATRKIKISFGEYYHIYNRGVDKRTIFLDQEDYEHFLFLMHICNTEKTVNLRSVDRDFNTGDPIVSIGLYCLMPNHFHILAKEISDEGITKYMLKLSTAYAMYFNKKYTRTGSLFEGTFKTTFVEKDTQLKYLYSYIHLNPAKLIDKEWKENRTKTSSELLNYVFEYPYSSIREYQTERQYILDVANFPRYFTNIDAHKKELFSWLNLE